MDRADLPWSTRRGLRGRPIGSGAWCFRPGRGPTVRSV